MMVVFPAVTHRVGIMPISSVTSYLCTPATHPENTLAGTDDYPAPRSRFREDCHA
jgi:hypothetical protein